MYQMGKSQPKPSKIYNMERSGAKCMDEVYKVPGTRRNLLGSDTRTSKVIPEIQPLGFMGLTKGVALEKGIVSTFQ